MNEKPYITEEKISEITGPWDINYRRSNSLYNWNNTISFKTQNEGTFCKGYLELIKYICPNISWLHAEYLKQFINVENETVHDYYSNDSTYKVWKVQVNNMIDYMIDELKLEINPEIQR